MIKVGIVGGGPGGLMAAHLLEQKCDAPCEITVFEASDRVGGKIITRRFEKADVKYEAGVAELYGYSKTGPDPLRDLIVDKLGLQIVPMDGETVVIDDKILRNQTEIKKLLGKPTLDAILDFRKKCQQLLTPEQYYEGHWQDDNDHDWAEVNCQKLLDENVADPLARKYLKVAAHSDLATEPHLTNGLNGLKNFLMDVEGFIELYSIVGGNELLIKKLEERLKQSPECTIKRNSPVVRIEKTPENKYRLTIKRDRKIETEDFDLVAIALPNNWVNTIDYGGERLSNALLQHHAYYDYPAHYVRVTILFEERYWKDIITDSWFMSDAFGGCCIYDETSRHEGNGYGALGWLIAGTDALTMANFSDEELIEKALQSLPEALQKGRELFVEGKVHRWLYSVNAQPGGSPVKDPKKRHIPEPKDHPGLYVIGDYLFDSTLNGVLDSADFVTDMMLDGMMRKWYDETVLANVQSDFKPQTSGFIGRKIGRKYFENYHGLGNYSDHYHRFFDAKFLKESIAAAWKPEKKYKLLVTGSGNGLVLEALSKVDIEGCGIENNRFIHAQTNKKIFKHNHLGDVRKLPFKDNQFDFVYETTLAFLSEREAVKAIKELHRVAKHGVILAVSSTDIAPQIVRKYRLFDGVRTLLTLWEWSELFLANGFDLEVNSVRTLKKLWHLEENSRSGEGSWYNDIESIRYCYFTNSDEDYE